MEDFGYFPHGMGDLQITIYPRDLEPVQGSTLAVFRYPDHPRFSDGIPDSPEQ